MKGLLLLVTLGSLFSGVFCNLFVLGAGRNITYKLDRNECYEINISVKNGRTVTVSSDNGRLGLNSCEGTLYMTSCYVCPKDDDILRISSDAPYSSTIFSITIVRRTYLSAILEQFTQHRFGYLLLPMLLITPCLLFSPR